MALTLVKELFQQKVSLLGLQRGNPKATGYVQTVEHSLHHRDEEEIIPEDDHPLICVPNFSHPSPWNELYKAVAVMYIISAPFP